MLGIGAIKAVVSIAPADDETSRFHLGQLILHGLERQSAQAREFPKRTIRSADW